MSLSPRDTFKVAFISRCIQDGLDIEQMTLRAKEAADQLEAAEKQAGIKEMLGLGAGAGLGAAGGSHFDAPGLGAGLGALASTEGGRSLLGGLAHAAIPLAVVAPFAVGGLGGYAAARATDVSDSDIQSVKDKELLDTYKLETNRLQRQKAVRDYHKRLAAHSRYRQP